MDKNFKFWLLISVAVVVVGTLLFLGISGTVLWKTLLESLGMILVGFPVIVIAVTVLITVLWGIWNILCLPLR